MSEKSRRVPNDRVFDAVFGEKGPEFSDSESEAESHKEMMAEVIEKIEVRSPDARNIDQNTSPTDDQEPSVPVDTSTGEKLPSDTVPPSGETGTSPSSNSPGTLVIAETPGASSSPPQSRPIAPATIIEEPVLIEFLPENDVRNRLEFSETIVRNTSFFDFKSRKQDEDIGASLGCEISRIPLLTTYVIQTINEYKGNYTKGDVSFKTIFFFKYSKYF